MVGDTRAVDIFGERGGERVGQRHSDTKSHGWVRHSLQRPCSQPPPAADAATSPPGRRARSLLPAGSGKAELL